MTASELNTSAGPVSGWAADGWSVEVRRDEGAFEAVRSGWEGLYARCPSATPFQSWGWLAAWWRSYGVPGRLRLVLVWHAGELVAALPLMLRRRHGHRVLVPLGEGITDYADVLADGRFADRALRIAAAALLVRREWAAIDLSEVRPGAVAYRLFELWPRTALRLPSSPCLEAPACSVDEYLRSLPGSRRRKARYALNRAEAQGLVVRDVPADEIGTAVATLLRLHERQWQGRNVNPEHLRPRFARHLTAALSVMVPAGQAVVTEYRLDGEVVGVVVDVIGHGLVGGYLYGIEPEARTRIDFMPLLITQLMGIADGRGKPVAGMLRGGEQHKGRWGFVPVRNEHLILGGRHPLRATAFLASARARADAATLVKERLPRLYPLLARARALGRRPA